MKVTLNWLKEYVDFDWSPEVLTERLTMLGLEVEGVEKQTGEFEGVVVAQILASEKHPNADKLSVCRVADGQGERQIVCGAKNYQAGDKVPLALPGCTLPPVAGQPPFTIKVSKMRGVESQGMLCSAKELQLAEDADGLLILPADAQVGQPLALHLGRTAGDFVFDLEVTPNRPDLNSVLGIAREISAVTGHPLRWPAVVETPVAEPVSSWVRVEVQDAELCPRYTARVVRGVKIGPSPAWLKNRLEQVGIRSINNVVDVTNFVMLEIGQPLHAFDFHLLQAEADGARTLVIRRAAAGEQFVTLDGKARLLSEQMLLIADRSKGIALAGIMGGQNTEIHERTTDVLIESAYFKPQNIRATSKKLDLRTDSSYRFERGADPGICAWASQRAAVLIQQLAGGTILSGPVDTHPVPAAPRQIELRTRKVEELLGVPVSAEDQERFLARLELPCRSRAPGTLTIEIPTFRVDLKIEVDLIEEITRLYGLERIPATPPRGAVGSHSFDPAYDALMHAREILAACGLTEAQGQTLISAGEWASLRGDDSPQPLPGLLRLENPLSSEMDLLRPALLPGLLDSMRRNAHHQTVDVRLFEIGRVFSGSGGETREERRVALALTGRRASPHWVGGPEREAKLDLFDLKGLVEEFFERLGVRGVQWQRTEPGSSRFWVECAQVLVGRQPVGELGQLHPVAARRYDLRDAVFAAEFQLDFLLSRRTMSKSFKTLASFPAIRRDVALLVAESVTHESVLAAVKQAKARDLETTQLFDIFRGQGIAAGRKSMAYSFTYRHPERTLTELEVQSVHERLIEQLRASLGAEIRA